MSERDGFVLERDEARRAAQVSDARLAEALRERDEARRERDNALEALRQTQLALTDARRDRDALNREIMANRGGW